MKFLRTLLPALMLCAAAPALAQNNKGSMTLHLSDGTTQQISVSTIDEVTFTPAAEPADFTLDSSQIYEYYGTISVAPAEGITTYNAMYLEKDYYDQYADEDAVVADDIQFYQDYADYYGYPLSDILSWWLYEGAQEFTMTELQPNTDYVFWCYGMNTNAELTTPFYKITFRTPAVSDISNTLTATATVSGTSVTLTVTPDDNSLRYFTGYLPVSAVSSADEVRDYMQSAIMENLSSYLYDYGYTDAQLLQDISYTGQQTQTFTGLEANTDYYILAGYISDHLTLVSPLALETVTTGSSASAAPAAQAAQEDVAPAQGNVEKTQGNITKALLLQPATHRAAVKRHLLRPTTPQK